MAYLKRQRATGGRTYLYIAKSVRKGPKVMHKVLEYLGREETVDAARLKRALKYWEVKARSGQRKRR